MSHSSPKLEKTKGWHWHEPPHKPESKHKWVVPLVAFLALMALGSSKKKASASDLLAALNQKWQYYLDLIDQYEADGNQEAADQLRRNLAEAIDVFTQRFKDNVPQHIQDFIEMHVTHEPAEEIADKAIDKIATDFQSAIEVSQQMPKHACRMASVEDDFTVINVPLYEFAIDKGLTPDNLGFNTNIEIPGTFIKKDGDIVPDDLPALRQLVDSAVAENALRSALTATVVRDSNVRNKAYTDVIFKVTSTKASNLARRVIAVNSSHQAELRVFGPWKKVDLDLEDSIWNFNHNFKRLLEAIKQTQPYERLRMYFLRILPYLDQMQNLAPEIETKFDAQAVRAALLHVLPSFGADFEQVKGALLAALAPIEVLANKNGMKTFKLGV